MPTRPLIPGAWSGLRLAERGPHSSDGRALCRGILKRIEAEITTGPCAENLLAAGAHTFVP